MSPSRSLSVDLCLYGNIHSALAGQKEPNVFEGTVDDYELLFKDKQTISVTIKNAYVEGLAAIPYTDCEVYTPLGYHTEVGL